MKLHPCVCRAPGCGEEFQTWRARVVHMQEMHKETSRTNCACPECGEAFTSRKLRHRHVMQVHRKLRMIVTPYSSRRAKRQRFGREKAHGQSIAA